MFSSSLHANMTCGLKLNTQSPGWHRTIDKVLAKIKGVNYSIDVEAGMAYISGRVDPQKILKKLAKAGKHADLCWVEAGNHNSMKPFRNDYGYEYPPAIYPMTHYYPQRLPYYGYGPYDYPNWA